MPDPAPQQKPETPDEIGTQWQGTWAAGGGQVEMLGMDVWDYDPETDTAVETSTDFTGHTVVKVNGEEITE